MKQFILSLVLIFTVTVLFAQHKKESMPANGFWVIESQVSRPESSTVYFYNSDQVLIYKEVILGKKLNVTRKRTVKQLNAVLAHAIIAWNNSPALRQDLHLVYNRR
jgi:hypothetical protein